jgi:hypothetical protein
VTAIVGVTDALRDADELIAALVTAVSEFALVTEALEVTAQVLAAVSALADESEAEAETAEVLTAVSAFAEARGEPDEMAEVVTTLSVFPGDSTSTEHEMAQEIETVDAAGWIAAGKRIDPALPK